MNITERYYAENSKDFFDSTVAADVTQLYERFLLHIPTDAYILDLGCGSGRDTKAFIERGYRVDAVDGSEELCRLASEYTGITVRCQDFSSIDCDEKYDAIWACASLLHISSRELPGLFEKLRRPIKPQGIFYMSFKYGDFEGERDGRFFNDMTAEKFNTIMKNVSGFECVDEWESDDVRRGKEVHWFNAIYRKTL